MLNKFSDCIKGIGNQIKDPIGNYIKECMLKKDPSTPFQKFYNPKTDTYDIPYSFNSEAFKERLTNHKDCNFYINDCAKIHSKNYNTFEFKEISETTKSMYKKIFDDYSKSSGGKIKFIEKEKLLDQQEDICIVSPFNMKCTDYTFFSKRPNHIEGNNQCSVNIDDNFCAIFDPQEMNLNPKKYYSESLPEAIKNFVFYNRKHEVGHCVGIYSQKHPHDDEEIKSLLQERSFRDGTIMAYQSKVNQAFQKCKNDNGGINCWNMIHPEMPLGKIDGDILKTKYPSQNTFECKDFAAVLSCFLFGYIVYKKCRKKRKQGGKLI